MVIECTETVAGSAKSLCILIKCWTSSGWDPLGKIPEDTPYQSKEDLHYKSPDAPRSRGSASPSLVGNEEEESTTTSEPEVEVVNNDNEIKVSSLRMTLIPDVDYHALYHGNFMDVLPIGDDVLICLLSHPGSGLGACKFGICLRLQGCRRCS